MKKSCAFSLFLAMMAIGLTVAADGYNLHRDPSTLASRIIETIGADTPLLTGFQLFLNGEPVDQIVSGKKLKKYSMKLTGSGFVSNSTLVVDPLNSITADPYGLEPEVNLATTVKNTSTLRAVFGHGSAPLPGLLSIKVVNPDGAESNTLTIDVISKPADLSVASISVDSGPIGAHVTLTGVGFEATGNIIRFSAIGIERSVFVGFFVDTPSDGKTLTFAVPDGESFVFPGRFPPPPVAFLPITPQQYRLSVINSNGLSNSLLFQVMSR